MPVSFHYLIEQTKHRSLHSVFLSLSLSLAAEKSKGLPTANSPLSVAAKPSSSPQPKSPTPRPLSLPLIPITPPPLRSAATPPRGSPSPAACLPSLKSLLRAGETLYGLFLLSSSPSIAEIAAFAEYDFVVAESTAVWAKKALAIVPEGIMFPMIDGPATRGMRSAHPLVRASKYGIDDGYLENCEENLLIMCQLESREGVKNAREIASIDGLDCIQMGPLDLSASMGYMNPTNKKVREMMRKSEEGVMGSGTAYSAGFAMPHDSPLELRRRDYNMVSGAVDVGLFRSTVVEDVKRFKMAFGRESSSDNEENERGKDADEKYWSK